MSSHALPTGFARGRYQVTALLGEGASKRVYLAHDTRLERDVAIAVIRTEGLDEARLARVRREAQAMARLGDHPHIVSIHDVGDEGGHPYIVSQYMAGGSLDDLLRRAEDHRLPIAQVLRIAVQICEALEHAHGQSVIHRDLKPSNVWLTRDGTAKLGDFGLAVALDRSRLSVEGMMVGTVAYMPPEQALGRAPDARSDLYSLGAVLYEMVTGRPPFVGDAAAVIAQHINAAPVAPSRDCPEMPQALEALILRLLAKTPGERPASATAVHEALGAISSAAPSRAGQPVHAGAHPLDPLPVTFLFTDLVNSTELLRRVGDERAQRIFQAHHKLLRDAVAANGGHEVKWLGDGLMVAFPSAAAAVRCAVAMQQAARRRVGGERLVIRVGLNAGEALREETDYFGTPVVVARRLCDRAEGGQILCAQLVAGLLAGRQAFRFSDCGQVELKGVAAPVGTCEVVYERDQPTVLLTHTPFVGRAAELARLTQKLQDVGAGHGGLVMLVGEAGIGKTRTAEEFAELARTEAALVLWGRCYEGEGGSPYGPFAEAIAEYGRGASPDPLRQDLALGAAPIARLVPALRERLPDIPEPVALQPDEERFRLLDAVSQFLIALSARARLVVVLDDLHWADKGTIAMLRHVARFVPKHRILLLGAHRDVELDRQHPLADALGSLRRETGYDRILLKGLDRGEVGELLETIADQEVPDALVTAISAETDGNPFLIREVLLHLAEEGKLFREEGRWISRLAIPEMGIPEGVRQVIGRRLSRLPEDANRLLGVAAAFNGAFRFDLVSNVAGLNEAAGLSAVDEALAAQLVRPGSEADSYDFTHALIRHTLYAELNPSRQVRLHRQIAEAMERVYGDRIAEHAAEVAYQYHRSAALPGAERGVVHALGAAGLTEAASAHDDAASFLRIALDLLPSNDARRPRLLGRLGMALIWSQAFDDALRLAAAGGDAIAEAEGKDAAADYLAEAAVAMSEGGYYVGGFALARQGLSYVGARRDPTWALLTTIDLIRRETEDPDYPGIPLDTPERREVTRIIFETAPARLPGTLSGALHLSATGFAGFYVNIASSRKDLLAHIPVPGVGVARVAAAAAALTAGDYRAGLAIFYTVAVEAEEQGRVGPAVTAWACAFQMHTALGEFARAREARQKSAALAARLTVASIHTAQLVAGEDEWRMALDEGWDEPIEHLGPGLGQGTVGAWYRARTEAAIARIHARMGRADRALRRLASVIPALEKAPGWAGSYTRMACDLAETLWLTERTDHIEAIERNVRDKVVVPDFRYPMMDGRLALARLCALQGRYDEAVEWFARARTVLDEQGARPLRAIVDYDEALMYLRRAASGDRERAAPLLDTALQQFHALGMTGWIRRAEKLRLRQAP